MSTTMTRQEADGKLFDYDIEAEFMDNPNIEEFYNTHKDKNHRVIVKNGPFDVEFHWEHHFNTGRWHRYFTSVYTWEQMKKYLTLVDTRDVELII